MHRPTLLLAIGFLASFFVLLVDSASTASANRQAKVKIQHQPLLLPRQKTDDGNKYPPDDGYPYQYNNARTRFLLHADRLPPNMTRPLADAFSSNTGRIPDAYEIVPRTDVSFAPWTLQNLNSSKPLDLYQAWLENLSPPSLPLDMPTSVPLNSDFVAALQTMIDFRAAVDKSCPLIFEFYRETAIAEAWAHLGMDKIAALDQSSLAFYALAINATADKLFWEEGYFDTHMADVSSTAAAVASLFIEADDINDQIINGYLTNITSELNFPPITDDGNATSTFDSTPAYITDTGETDSSATSSVEPADPGTLLKKREEDMSNGAHHDSMDTELTASTELGGGIPSKALDDRDAEPKLRFQLNANFMINAMLQDFIEALKISQSTNWTSLDSPDDENIPVLLNGSRNALRLRDNYYPYTTNPDRWHWVNDIDSADTMSTMSSIADTTIGIKDYYHMFVHGPHGILIKLRRLRRIPRILYEDMRRLFNDDYMNKRDAHWKDHYARKSQAAKDLVDVDKQNAIDRVELQRHATKARMLLNDEQYENWVDRVLKMPTRQVKLPGDAMDRLKYQVAHIWEPETWEVAYPNGLKDELMKIEKTPKTWQEAVVEETNKQIEANRARLKPGEELGRNRGLSREVAAQRRRALADKEWEEIKKRNQFFTRKTADQYQEAIDKIKIRSFMRESVPEGFPYQIKNNKRLGLDAAGERAILEGGLDSPGLEVVQGTEWALASNADGLDVVRSKTDIVSKLEDMKLWARDVSRRAWIDPVLQAEWDGLESGTPFHELVNALELANIPNDHNPKAPLIHPDDGLGPSNMDGAGDLRISPSVDLSKLDMAQARRLPASFIDSLLIPAEKKQLGAASPKIAQILAEAKAVRGEASALGIRGLARTGQVLTPLVSTALEVAAGFAIATIASILFGFATAVAPQDPRQTLEFADFAADVDSDGVLEYVDRLWRKYTPDGSALQRGATDPISGFFDTFEHCRWFEYETLEYEDERYGDVAMKQFADFLPAEGDVQGGAIRNIVEAHGAGTSDEEIAVNVFDWYAGFGAAQHGSRAGFLMQGDFNRDGRQDAVPVAVEFHNEDKPVMVMQGDIDADGCVEKITVQESAVIERKKYGPAEHGCPAYR